MELKRCTKCGELKEHSAFGKQKHGKNGLRSSCSICHRLANKQYDDTHKKQRAEYGKLWRLHNREKMRAYSLKSRNKNIDAARARLAKWKATPEAKEIAKRWVINNREKIKIQRKIWRTNHPEKQKEWQKKSNDKSRSTPRGSINHRVSAAINGSLKNSKKGRGWESLVGYTVDDLRLHLERKFTKGMTWEKFIAGEIHIDHKIPKSAFNFEQPEDIDFKRCWALKNLRPMWAVDNMRKSSKLEKPFQPALALSL